MYLNNDKISVYLNIDKISMYLNIDKIMVLNYMTIYICAKLLFYMKRPVITLFQCYERNHDIIYAQLWRMCPLVDCGVNSKLDKSVQGQN